MPDLLSDYLTRESAGRIGVNPFTLDRWRTARKGPPVTMLGRRILYRKSSLIAWLASQEENRGEAV